NVIRRQGSGVAETYTVRKVSYGVGVERTFPVHTPTVAKLEVVKRGDVRRAKLYYLRDRVGKAAKIREKRDAVAFASLRCDRTPALSSDDLENFEAERELQLAQEYQDVASRFRSAVATARWCDLDN